MKKRFVILVVLAGTCFVCSPRTHAQAEGSSQSNAKEQAGIDQIIELVRTDLRSQRRQLVAANLKLTDDQATKFWPVYDQYTAELTKLGDEKSAMFKDIVNQWGTMTDEQASSLIQRSLAIDEQLAQLRIKYKPIFSKAVPGKVVASFFQLDRRIQALIDIRLASQIPLVQAQE